MQFVKDGPDVPERLLQAHEDGNVVFFCGAGISCPAGLPGFKGLVTRLFESLAVEPNSVQRAAIKAKQFDTAISLLESDIVEGRAKVRRAIAKILTPSVPHSNATATHEALLTLGSCRNGHLRLITTNFDRLFEEVIATKQPSIDRFQAPMLPVPKSSWNGLVYLHGMLSAAPTTSELNRLVLSSGDFGRAYLTERWGARFLSELFRNYSVCFVGYSITDPVLRYMMDALAADRLLGESSPEMFALGSYSKGKEKDRANEWLAKNVSPILYREHNRHAYLHQTLRAWAQTYRDGSRGKERIVIECAMARPSESTRQDDFAGRLLWALSHPDGLPARRFADLDPAPALDWLEYFAEPRYRHNDLERFGVTPRKSEDENLSFSLIRRPSAYPLAPFQCLADAGALSSRWDEVMRQLARWLIRHLDDPVLILWLAKNGGQLHPDLGAMIDRRLGELASFESANKITELDKIRAHAPRAIPRPAMRTLWGLLLTNRVKSGLQDFDLYRWSERFKRDGFSASLRLELRELLTPRVALRDPVSWPEYETRDPASIQIKDLVRWDIALSTSHVHSALEDLSKNDQWNAVLPELLSDISTLLRDAMDLMSELGSADDRSDLSYMDRPSIGDHPQNRDFHDWTALIDLARDSWLATAAQSLERAALAARSWRQVPYPLFRRLSFFAAATKGVIPESEARDWLLSDEHWWLWSMETERETLRLLVALTQRIDSVMLQELEDAILAGPPREMHSVEADMERRNYMMDHAVWLRLAKIADAGAVLSAYGKQRLAELSSRHPDWNLAKDESDEFPYWMGDGSEWRKFVSTPRRRRELMQWLRNNPGTDHWQEDDWLQRCRDDFATPACALYALSTERFWPTERWREALQAWSDERLLKISWRYMAPIFASAPEGLIESLARSISWWLKSIAKTFEGHDAIFVTLVQRILELDHQDEIDTDDPVMAAINHPVGHVTEALLRRWYRHTLQDGQRLPDELNRMLAGVCDPQVRKYRHGRVVLAAHVINFYRVDEEWARQNILPIFDWRRSHIEAQAVWQGFLWSPRIYRPLIQSLKPAFLDTARHYSQLGRYKEQYASLLTFISLDRIDCFSTTELASATESLPQDGLEQCASVPRHKYCKI